MSAFWGTAVEKCSLRDFLILMWWTAPAPGDESP